MDIAQQVKYAQLDLMTELDRICKKHDLPYFMVGGTLIGAIRHNGFIPWDDDIDVGMLWEDYNKLREACQADLDSAYQLQDWYTDPHSPHPFFKLKIRGTHYRESVSEHSAMDDSIFIDIFPYDNTPSDPAVQKKQARQLYVLRRLLMVRAGFRLGKESKAKKLVYGLLRAVSLLIPMQWMKRRFDAICAWGGDGASELVTCLHGAYDYKRETKPRAMLEKTVPHVFEQGEFAVPQHYDAFLRSHYGNYMQLPPEDQRVGVHGVRHMDLGGYCVRSRLANTGEEKENHA